MIDAANSIRALGHGVQLAEITIQVNGREREIRDQGLWGVSFAALSETIAIQFFLNGEGEIIFIYISQKGAFESDRWGRVPLFLSFFIFFTSKVPSFAWGLQKT